MKTFYGPDIDVYNRIKFLEKFLGKIPTAKFYQEYYGLTRSRAYRELALANSPLYGNEEHLRMFRVREEELAAYINMRVRKHQASAYIVAAELGISNVYITKYLEEDLIPVYGEDYPICPVCGINTMHKVSKMCKECKQNAKTTSV